MVWAREHIQRKLLAEADLTYERAKAIDVAAETASKDAVELRNQAPAVEVNKVRASGGDRKTKVTPRVVCTRCGKSNH